MTVLFLSDLHIDADAPRVLRGFRGFLAREAPRADALYILGDLVEVWVGDDDDGPTAVAVREALAAATAHCPVFVMHGNRDFLLGDGFASDTGVTLVPDPHVLQPHADGPRLLLAHGDAFCTRDVAYQEARAVLRSPAWQAEVLARTLPERRALARSLREESRAANANKAENIMDVTEEEVVAAMLRHDCPVLIHGHTHRPGVHPVALGPNGREGRRYVLGDWGRCGWTLRLDGEMTLECFALADTV